MRNHLRWLFLFLIGVAFIGCQDDLNINSPVNNQGGSSFSLNKISPAIETQTKDLDLTGSKIILAGIGTYVNGTGTISVNVPSGTIKNVFLYWEGRHQASGSLFPNGDSQIKVNGVAIDGELIGKANQEGTNRGFVFRADVTSKGFVTNGANSLSVSDFVGAATIYDRADGVGVMVVVDDGSKASLEVRDGADWAYLKSDPTYPWLLVTEAQTFTFDASTVERKADLSLFVGDLGVVNGTPRPHHMEITVGDGAVQSIAKPFYNNSGPQWDTYTKELTIPAGVTKVKVQIFSDPDESATVQAASLLWFLTSLKISTPANLAAIGDRTWKDLDGDGIQDDGEPGFEGVKVELYTCAGDLVATQYTDANGNYLFTDLTPGSYSLQFYTPDGWAITLQDAPGSTSETDSDIFPETGKTICTDLTAGEVDRRWDAGYVQLQLKSKLGDFVWNDLNKNGVQENGEVGVPNVKVDLLDCSDNFIATTNTNEQGYYYFDDLNAGEYKVKFYLPNGYAFSPKDANGDDTKDSDAGLDGITDCINLPGGVEDLTWDAGIYLSTLNKLGDFVWHDKNVNGIQDAGEPGITGVKVELLSGNTVISTTTTDANGKYEFSNLANGNYCVRVAASNYEVGGVLYSTAQTKWYATKKDQGSDNAKDSDAGKNESVCVTLNNNDDLTLDFGFYKTCVSVTKLADKKTAKPGETITYTFVVENCGDITLGGGVDLFDPLLNPTAPHKIGNLTPVHPGTTKTLTKTYCVTSKDCGDLVNTVKAVGHPVDGSANVEFSASVTVKIDCTAPAKLGDKVWLDKDNDGIQDYGEPGVHNVKVELYDCAGKLIATTSTNYNGYYYFSNLNPGDYKVKFYTPTGYGFTKKDQGSNDEVDSDVDPNTGFTTCVTLTSGKNDLKWDAGIYCLPLSKLGDKVWVDTDKDGIQDYNESGIKNIKVELYNCSDKLLSTTYTDYYGKYYFNNLAAGDYKVKFYAPTGYGFTKKDQGSNDEVDSDVDPTTGFTTCITLTAGKTDLKWDAGIYCLPTSKLGDKVWLDKDKDGIQDSGEPGVKDVKVQLYSSTGTHLATTYTSYYGYYSFSNLTAGSYKVKFNLPAGYAFTKVDQGTSDEKDSDANQETGYTVTINLAAGVTDLKWDAGIVSKSSCFSPGYWKTHSKYGPANPYDPTWSKCGTKGEDTPFFKCGNSWYKAFHQSVEGNHYYILAHQYMAAKLNQHWGAFCPPDVKNALSECESIFNQYSPSQIKYGSTTLKNKCTTLASLLDKFNNQ